jgi:hypothetical protein
MGSFFKTKGTTISFETIIIVQKKVKKKILMIAYQQEINISNILFFKGRSLHLFFFLSFPLCTGNSNGGRGRSNREKKHKHLSKLADKTRKGAVPGSSKKE